MTKADKCRAGFYCSDPAAPKEQSNCEKGTYPNEDRTQCVECEAGFYCNKQKKRYCQIGEYCNITGLFESLGQCPLGHYCPKPEDDPIICPSGYYQNTIGSTKCIKCQKGPYRFYKL